MKKEIHTFFRVVCFSTFFLAAASTVLAAGKTSGEESRPAPLVRVDVLMVAMPEEKFITLLPDLTDPEKIEKTFPALLEAVKRKEMILEGYPFVTTKSCLRAGTETYKEFRDPWQPLEFPLSVPKAFQTRQLGVSLDVITCLSRSPQIIDLTLESRQVNSLKPRKKQDPDGKKTGETSNEKDSNPASGRYLRMKTSTSVSLVDGQHLFFSSHKLAEPEGYVEVVIVHAQIIPVGP